MPVFGGSHLTSDAGWGCMLRSAQMLMAQALMLHYQGRQWRWSKAKPTKETINLSDYVTLSRKGGEDNLFSNSEDESIHRNIIRQFSDVESNPKMAPFSIHNLVQLSTGLGRSAGNWFGPSTAAFLLQMAWLNHTQAYAAEKSINNDSFLEDLAVYVAQDCTVYKEDVINICSGDKTSEFEQEGFAVMTSDQLDYSYSEEVTVDIEEGGTSWCLHQSKQNSTTTWKSVLILIPIRVGGEKLNPVYGDCLKNLLTLPCCVGWIGGKPSHSLYFIGYQDDHLLHLDPHRIQPGLDTLQDKHFPLDSFHCSVPRKLLITKMDPSCCIGFYLRTRDEFESWCYEIESYVTPKLDAYSPSKSCGNSGQTLHYPLFTIQMKSAGGSCAQRKSRDEDTDWVNMEQDAPTSGGATAKIGEARAEQKQDSEDFVFL